MPKTRKEKEVMVQDYVEKIQKSKGLVFANFDGLKVKEIEELRKQCREESVDYVVAKKTLMKIAFEKAGIKDVDPKILPNSVASIFGYNDEIVSAKIIGQYSKSHESLRAVGGVLENKFIDSTKVIELSKLPSRLELLAKAVGSIKAPVSGFVNVLAGNLRGLVGVLNAIKENK